LPISELFESWKIKLILVITNFNSHPSQKIISKKKERKKIPPYFTNFTCTGVGLDTVFATGDAFFASSINSCKVSSEASDSILKEMFIP
jgi:hypothetical protein